MTEQGLRLGLISGGGRFPFMVAEGAKRAGWTVVAVGLRGFADPQLQRIVDEFHWSSVVRVGQWIRIFQRCFCNTAIMAGSVRKADMYGLTGWRRVIYYCPDWTTFKLWFFQTTDKRTDTLLRAVADNLARKGIVLENSTRFVSEAMAPEGVLTRRLPTPAQEKDIEFGWRIAKELGRLDIGQSVAVKDQDIIAVEAIEGTDRMIARAGELCRSGGWCHVKVSKPDQDMRFDVPTIGPDTITNLHRHGAKLLCVEADKTLIVERDKLLALAEQLGVVVVARKDHYPD
ncbi:MAG: UDP-2,3-diacylglucosamine pyrophosphatase LpxI [Phycisphaerae bacterium]|nr:UDP-2,3-diacylglucosamine pyrophosphatase LpxI [Phycisphaerae bacterium]